MQFTVDTRLRLINMDIRNYIHRAKKFERFEANGLKIAD